MVFTIAHTNALGKLMSIVKSSRSACPRCGTIKKSGQLNCCARGGAWFNECGDPGDSNFGHTWFEGIQACKYLTRSFAVEAQVNLMLRYEETTITKQFDTDQQQKSTLQSTIDLTTDTMYDVDYTSSKDCDEITKIVTFITTIRIVFLSS